MRDGVSLGAVMQEHFSEAQRIAFEVKTRATLLTGIDRERDNRMS